jgi:choline dehydrogenase-like flavoprotein
VISPDFVIIGTGAGGGTVARALSFSGAKVLILERGDFLPVEPENWSPAAVFLENRYKTMETWVNAGGREYKPGIHYWVGGNTKVYGAALPRLREEDFGCLEHEGGTSPGWPISYADLEPYYGIAEKWYWVHGESGIDPTEAPRSTPFPFPAIPADPYMSGLAESFREQGLNPFPLPLGLDYHAGGKCIRCRTCDAFPCRVDAKADSDICAVRPALEDPNVTLWTSAFVRRLRTDESGRKVNRVEIQRNGSTIDISPDKVVVACGAVNSAALLLRSASSMWPDGLANSSGVVGRNYMVHNNSVLLALSPTLVNPVVVQKAFAINDFYFRGPAFPWPMGNLQPVGKVQLPMLRGVVRTIPDSMLVALADRSTDWWVMSEDLPDPDNRVTLGPNDRIRVRWKPNNLVAHHKLLKTAKTIFRAAGYPVVWSREMGIETNSHQVGTIRFGDDPATSALDPHCKAHVIDNLYVVDGSFFPSSSAVNPALTIMAQAIRVGDHLLGRQLRPPSVFATR